jgi:hypothetical protein
MEISTDWNPFGRRSQGRTAVVIGEAPLAEGALDGQSVTVSQ